MGKCFTSAKESFQFPKRPEDFPPQGLSVSYPGVSRTLDHASWTHAGHWSFIRKLPATIQMRWRLQKKRCSKWVIQSEENSKEIQDRSFSVSIAIFCSFSWLAGAEKWRGFPSAADLMCIMLPSTFISASRHPDCSLLLFLPMWEEIHLFLNKNRPMKLS